MTTAGDTLWRERIMFHGRIVTDATHEIQNHFAVIKEYSGLIGDLLQAKRGDAATIDRCTQITRDINERANRAAVLVDKLNHFGHRGDAAVCTFRLDAVVEELVALMQRAASQRRVSMEASHGRKAPEITSNASLLQYLLHSIAAPLLDAMEEGGRITITASRGKAGAAQVEIETKGAAHEAAEPAPWAGELIDACLAELDGSLTHESRRGNSQRITISVPSLSASD